ncbi:MAG: segregation/condensation protein A [Myxococcales bacterium]|nr:segregation/condensation protein A [Myxococcales bacterium]USN50136.1 MAG: segregation/condensation protein A [Myxococcales bacterium]
MNERKESLAMTSIEIGDTAVRVKARGRFCDKDALDFVPTPESLMLHIDTPNYDGPLDLLLHLIRKHSMDIFDIPIMLITTKYLEALDEMKKLNLDVAGEFLVMAATLAEIKSKMLLPKEEQIADGHDEAEEGVDPRSELIRRLLLYKSYQEASQELLKRPTLGQDIFYRHIDEEVEDEEQEEPEGEVTLAPIEIFQLVDKLATLLKKSEKHSIHTITRDRISVSARINELMDFCQLRTKFSFYDALRFFPIYERIDVIVTFLALLEMSRLKLLRLQVASVDDLVMTVRKENFYTLKGEMLGILNNSGESDEHRKD